MKEGINKRLKASQLNKWEDEDEMNIKMVFLESEKNKEINYGYNTSDCKCV